MRSGETQCLCLEYEPVNMELVLPLETDEFAGCKIRRTPEVPPRVSVYDLIAAVKGCSDDTARKDFSRIKKEHPTTEAWCLSYKFDGPGNQTRPVTNAEGVVCLLHILQGSRAILFQAQAMKSLLTQLCLDEAMVQKAILTATRTVRSLCQQRLGTRTTSGYVYLVTSPLINAVKIGSWGGSVSSLRSRYTTTYGRNILLKTVHVTDRWKDEARMHNMFSYLNIECELFDKHAMGQYQSALEQL